MSTEDLAFAPIGELASLIQEGELSPVQLTHHFLQRIESYDSHLLSYITVIKERALCVARAAEMAIAAGQYLGPLHGIPFALKDLVDTAGIPTTGGSQLLRDRVPSSSATVANRLEKSGAVLLGKLNLTEFALAGRESTHTSAPHETLGEPTVSLEVPAAARVWQSLRA